MIRRQVTLAGHLTLGLRIWLAVRVPRWEMALSGDLALRVRVGGRLAVRMSGRQVTLAGHLTLGLGVRSGRRRRCRGRRFGGWLRRGRFAGEPRETTVADVDAEFRPAALVTLVGHAEDDKVALVLLGRQGELGDTVPRVLLVDRQAVHDVEVVIGLATVLNSPVSELLHQNRDEHELARVLDAICTLRCHSRLSPVVQTLGVLELSQPRAVVTHLLGRTVEPDDGQTVETRGDLRRTVGRPQDHG